MRKAAKVGTRSTRPEKNMLFPRESISSPLSKDEEARWVKAVEPVLEDYVKTTEAKGLPGREALTFCQEWLKKNR